MDLLVPTTIAKVVVAVHVCVPMRYFGCRCGCSMMLPPRYDELIS